MVLQYADFDMLIVWLTESKKLADIVSWFYNSVKGTK